jgi:hypothetical protein
MMNGREKSDPAVVAVKSTNEAGQPGEEWMEPRAGKCGLAKHAPNSVSGWRVPCARSHTTGRATAV